MSNLENSTDTQSGLEKTFLDRVNKKRDGSAAALLRELLEDVEGIRQRGLKAIELWPKVQKATLGDLGYYSEDFPQTYELLWGAMIEGWFASTYETKIGVFLSSTHFPGKDKGVKNRLSAKLREGLDALPQAEAFRKVKHFLQLSPGGHAPPEITTLIARMLGRYAPIKTTVFLSHFLDCFSDVFDAQPGKYHSIAMEAAGHYASHEAERALEAVSWVSKMLEEIGLPTHRLSVRLETPYKVEITWSQDKSDAGSEAEISESTRIVEERAEKIRNWNKRYPQGRKMEYELHLYSHRSKPHQLCSGASVTV